MRLAVEVLVRWMRFFSPVFFCLVTALDAAALPDAPPARAAAPIEVTVGTYVNQIHAVNLRDNVFTADFYIWFRWKEDGVNPIETFEIMNGRISDKKIVAVRDVYGEHYAQARVIAVINKLWDVSRFPLDRHELPIFIEDQDMETSQLHYVADIQNTNFDKDLKILGYNVTDGAPSVTLKHYNTNYGDNSLPAGNKSIYSRYGYAILISRPGYGYFLKMFATTFISVMVGFVAFLLKPGDLGPRFSLGVGSLFALVASTFVIASKLPDSDKITLADRINIASMVMMFLSLIISVMSLKMHEHSHGGSLLAKRMNVMCLVGFPVIYTLWILAIVLVH